MNRLITILSNRLTNGSLKKSKQLYEAMEKNDFTLFKKLVESGTTFKYITKDDNPIIHEFPDLLNQKNSEQKTPLHLAVIYRCHDMLDFLLTHKGLDVTIKDIDGDSAAMYALYWNDSSDTFHKIIEYDSKAVNVPNSKGEIPLIFYIKYIADPKGLLPGVTWLIEIGSDLRLQDNDGNTALHYAVMQQNQEVIDTIFKKNPELAKIRNNNYETPFEFTPNQQ